MIFPEWESERLVRGRSAPLDIPALQAAKNIPAGGTPTNSGGREQDFASLRTHTTLAALDIRFGFGTSCKPANPCSRTSIPV